MPFAVKFRAMMDMFFPGDTVGGFVVESLDVGHQGIGGGRYVYPVRIILRGPGGQQGVRRALKPLLTSHPFTFSGFGTPYQMWFDRAKVESLGERRYEVRVEGIGCRMFLGEQLERFLEHLESIGIVVPMTDEGVAKELVEEYLTEYKAEVARTAGRYRRKVKKIEREAR